MSSGNSHRLTVSSRVARLVKEGSCEEQRAALCGDYGLALKDRLSLSLFLLQRNDGPQKAEIVSALGATTAPDYIALLADPDLHSRHLELIARIRLDDVEVIKALLEHPALLPVTLGSVARHCNAELFAYLAQHPRYRQEYPQLNEDLQANRRVDPSWKEVQLSATWESSSVAGSGEVDDAGHAVAESDDEPETDAESEPENDELVNLSKYQMSLELPVAEKIKLALTGDKEWRSILIKDSNKLVSSGVLKNPRITDGEVLAIAKNKSSSEELIRLITMNNEWLKNYEIKRALVLHNRTPLPKALRFMSILSEKDIKSLAKSRDVSSVLSNNARRMIMAKDKKK